MRSSLCACPAILSAEAEFLNAYPEYAATEALDQLRVTEYARLNEQDHIYLDYTGGGLYAASQLRAHQELLASDVFGNPHSHNPSSARMTEIVERARARVHAFFNAPPADYAVIFTANASHALKLVGESYPFAPGGHYLLTFDNHNSVNGIREFARARGAEITYIPIALPEMRVDEAALESHLQTAQGGHNLFAYPAQSNFSGVQHPLEWIARAHDSGWDVLLDAAAFVPTNRLDVARWQPDFVTLSFYKMFGYPTGIGCLIARRSALAKLHRPWFAGGTITVASVQGDQYFPAEGASAFEDGTLDYLGIPGVEIGLRHLESAGIDVIHTRCRCLTGWLIAQVPSLRHANGAPLIRLYGPANLHARGGTLAMNFHDESGGVIDHLAVEEAALRYNLSLRTGCFCNPGGGEIALRLSRSELVGCFSRPEVRETHQFTAEDFKRCIDGKSTGAVRISVGIASNFADVYRFIAFAREFIGPLPPSPSTGR